MSQQFIKANTAEGYRQQIAGLVDERLQHSKNSFSSIRQMLPQLYNLYRGTLQGRTAPHKNNVHIPLIFSTLQSDVARKTQTSFGSWPIVSFVGYSQEDAIIARKRESLIYAQFKDADSFQKGYDLFLTADLYGTGIIEYGWDFDVEDMMVQHTEVLPYTGKISQFLEKKSVIGFDGPNWRVLDSLDCYPQPGIRDAKDMDWFITADYMDFDEVKRRSIPNERGVAIFEAKEVARMEQEDFRSAVAADDYKSYRATSRNMMDENSKLREKYARPVKLVTYRGRIPSELVPGGEDDVTLRQITIANDKYVLRNRPLPFWNNKIPIMAYSPMPDPHFFFGTGKAEIAAQMQIVANRFTNQQLDSLDMYVDPVFIVNEDAGVDEENLLLRPGKWIRTQGNPSEMIMPLIPNLQGLQVGGMMTETLWRWMQQGLGIIEDTVMGGGASNRQTAREFMGRSEAVATRLLLESRLFEENLLEPLADAFVDLNRQFLTTPKEVMMLGKSAQIDPITGMSIPQTTRTMNMDGWDLVPNYEARAVGSTTRMGKASRQQALTFLVQAVSQSPLAQSAFNWSVFMRELARAFDIENVDEMIASPEQQEKMMQQLQGGATPPQQVPGTPNSVGEGSFGITNYPGQGLI